MTLDPTSWAWLAGLWDGEGAVGLRIDRKDGRPLAPTVSVQMSMTCERTIQRVIALLKEGGCRAVGYSYQQRQPGKHRNAHYIRIARLVDVHVAAVGMLPFAVTKAEHWRIVRDYAASRLKGASVRPDGRVDRGGKRARPVTEEELQWIDQIRRMNLRGPVAIRERILSRSKDLLSNTQPSIASPRTTTMPIAPASTSSSC